MYNNVLLYDHLYSYIIIYTYVFFIVYWCTYNVHAALFRTVFLWSIHYICTRITFKGGGVFYCVHPWVYQCYFAFEYEIKMKHLPFTDLSEKNMLAVFRVVCCNEPSTNFLETNNDQLISIDPDLHVYTNTFIGVCETWATQLNEDLLNIPGYKHEHYII